MHQGDPAGDLRVMDFVVILESLPCQVLCLCPVHLGLQKIALSLSLASFQKMIISGSFFHLKLRKFIVNYFGFGCICGQTFPPTRHLPSSIALHLFRNKPEANADTPHPWASVFYSQPSQPILVYLGQ